MLNTQKTRQAVCVWDPAIDTEATDIVAYVQKRDITKVVYRLGTKPELYSLRPLTHDVCAYVCSAPEGPERQARAFFACVVKVDNLLIFNEEGVKVGDHAVWAPDSVKEKPERLANTFDLFTKEEKAIFSPATVYEIGEVAWRFSFFPRGIAPLFALPPTSVQIWTAAFSLPAAPVESIQETGTSEPTQP